MSHPRVRTEQQRRVLSVAEPEVAQLLTLLARARHLGLSAHDWLSAAALAAGTAEHVQHLADLTDRDPARWLWDTTAARMRGTAARFELWGLSGAGLAGTAA